MNERIDESRARRLFSAKGFGSPTEFVLGDARLWVFKKQLVGCEDHYHMESGEAVEALAAPVFSAEVIREERTFVLKKLGISNEEWASIMAAAPKIEKNYPSNRILIKLVCLRPLLGRLKREVVGRRGKAARPR